MCDGELGLHHRRQEMQLDGISWLSFSYTKIGRKEINDGSLLDKAARG